MKKIFAVVFCALIVGSAAVAAPSVLPDNASALSITANAAVASGVYNVGSRGTQVQYLQWTLNALNYNCGTADGIYGNATKQAVLRFQRAYGLTADGIAGPQTINKLNSVAYSLQDKLCRAGYSVTKDSILGPATRSQIGRFNAAHGIKGDVATQATWDALNKAQNSSVSAKKLNKAAVLNYANTYWNKRNPNYYYYTDNNCCNYVSQCLVAGGLSTNSTFKNGTSAFIYIPSFKTYMQNTLGVKYISYPSASQIEVGDVIMTSSSHVMIVTRKEGNRIYCNGNTNNRYQLQVSWFYGVFKTSSLMK